MIDQYGSHIPRSFPIPHPLDFVVIDLPLTSDPIVMDYEIIFYSLCGSDYVHHPVE